MPFNYLPFQLANHPQEPTRRLFQGRIFHGERGDMIDHSSDHIKNHESYLRIFLLRPFAMEHAGYQKRVSETKLLQAAGN